MLNFHPTHYYVHVCVCVFYSAEKKPVPRLCKLLYLFGKSKQAVKACLNKLPFISVGRVTVEKFLYKFYNRGTEITTTLHYFLISETWQPERCFFYFYIQKTFLLKNEYIQSTELQVRHTK